MELLWSMPFCFSTDRLTIHAKLLLNYQIYDRFSEKNGIGQKVLFNSCRHDAKLGVNLYFCEVPLPNNKVIEQYVRQDLS